MYIPHNSNTAKHIGHILCSTSNASNKSVLKMEFRNNLDEIREELNLNPPLMPSQEVIDEVSLILTITGFKDKIEKIRASQEEE